MELELNTSNSFSQNNHLSQIIGQLKDTTLIKLWFENHMNKYETNE
jgi:hypothetical protein